MPEYRKMTRFLPPAGDYALEKEFECWHPDPGFAFAEKPGAVSWVGPEIPPLKADAALPFVNLPDQLEKLIKHCWQKASVSPGGSRGPVQIAGARQQAFHAQGLQIGGARAQAGMAQRGQYQPMVSPTNPAAPLPHLQGVANDWKVHEQLERINAYAFRGDTRNPNVIKAASGFTPPSSRTDAYYVENGMYPQFASYMERRFQIKIDKQTFLDAYNKTVTSDEAKRVMMSFSIWRALADAEALHAGRMVANEALKGYISTTRAVSVAKHFAKAGGWVYMVLVQGGFLLPAKGKHVWTQIFGEQEIAMPVPIPWSNVFAFRQVQPQGMNKFAGPLYYRRGFDKQNPDVFKASYDLLSGKAQ